MGRVFPNDTLDRSIGSIAWQIVYHVHSYKLILESKLKDDAASESDEPEAKLILHRVLSLYRGDFLGDENEASWALRPRLRLRADFIRLIVQSGRRCETVGDWSAALQCYERGLQADDLAEDLY